MEETEASEEDSRFPEMNQYGWYLQEISFFLTMY